MRDLKHNSDLRRSEMPPPDLAHLGHSQTPDSASLAVASLTLLDLTSVYEQFPDANSDWQNIADEIGLAGTYGDAKHVLAALILQSDEQRDQTAAIHWRRVVQLIAMGTAHLGGIEGDPMRMKIFECFPTLMGKLGALSAEHGPEAFTAALCHENKEFIQ
jgi:hypothetical protein